MPSNGTLANYVDMNLRKEHTATFINLYNL